MKKIIKTIIITISSIIAVTAITLVSIYMTNNNKGADNIENKYISFMGDSITTYYDYSNNTDYNTTIGNNDIWYPKGEIDSVDFTWWKQTINELNLNLCVNNSWSGSRVTASENSSSAACMDRSYNLHNDVENITPDIIVIYIGINDFNGNVKLGSFTNTDDIHDSTTNTYIGNVKEFAPAYATMIHKIKSTYKDADIYCCTMYNNGNDDLRKWNIAIKNIASYYNCKIVDFYYDTKINGNNLLDYTIDWLHPNENGMKEMSSCLKKALLKYSN